MADANGKQVPQHTAPANGSAPPKYDDRGPTSGDELSGDDKLSDTNRSPASTTATLAADNDGGCGGGAPTTTVPTNVAVPPDGGWGWVVVVASFLCNLVVDGIIYSFGMFMAAIGETFGESKAKVALIGSLLSGSYLVAGPFASALANRYGFRRVTIAGAALSGVAFFASSFATNIQFLYITYGVIGGVGFGLIFVPAVIVIGFYFEKWRALATGFAVCGSGIGTFVMAPLSRWLIRRYSWQQALLIQAGFILNCAVFGALFRPLEQMQVQVPVIETTTPSSDVEDSTKDKKLPLLLKTKVLRDLNGRSKSSLSIYEDVGLIVDNGDEAKDAYFSGNANYPTASQILQLEAIPDQEDEQGDQTLQRRNRSHSHSNGTATVTDTEHIGNQASFTVHRVKHMVMSNRELNTNPQASPRPSLGARGRNKSVSPLPQKRNSLVPETRILLDRKYSLQPPTTNRSQSLTASGILANGTKGPIVRRNTDMGNRPLYRDDIFFNSNLRRLSQYNSQTSSLNYTMSVTRLPTYNDILEEKKKKFTILPEAVRRTLATMLDLSLLKSVTFIILAISGFFTAMGMFTPFMYITERAEEMGTEGAVWLMPVLGIANTVGRVGFGVISSIPRTNAVQINNISLTICGIGTALSGLVATTSYQFGYACLFGATLACFSSLRTIIVVELLGLEKLTNAFGLLLLFQGVAAIMGPPLAGYIVDLTNEYEYSFYASGAFIVLSAVICYPIEAISKWENERKNKHIKSSK